MSPDDIAASVNSTPGYQSRHSKIEARISFLAKAPAKSRIRGTTTAATVEMDNAENSFQS
jgi:hypothetical protein